MKYLFLFSLLIVAVSAGIRDDLIDGYNFTGKVVLITGSSSGIGEQTVKLFSSLGASVVVTGRNKTNVKRVAEEVNKLSPHGLQPLEVVADLNKDEDIERLINETIANYGRLDVLVNNAGDFRYGLINDSFILSQFDDQLRLNLRAPLYLTHLSVPYLQKTKGTIINISAVLSVLPVKGFLVCSMLKTSQDMLTKVAAVELGPYGIRVNTISPGKINTNTNNNMTSHELSEMELILAELDKRAIENTPLRRAGTPLEVAEGIAFLASKNAEFITGVYLLIDGGVVFARI